MRADSEILADLVKALSGTSRVLRAQGSSTYPAQPGELREAEPLAENQGRASPVIVSLLRECRPGELRVLLLPRDAARLCEICDLQVETGAGRGLGVADEDYVQAGARITSTRDAWGRADFLLKLKAPTVAEVRRIRRGASIAALFHAEGIPDVVAELVARRITAYSFEYFRDGDGAFPLMAATGEIAGQMAVIYAAYHLQSHLDGSGVSLPACIYAPAARVAVIGYGNAGRAATKTALALGAEVTVYVRHQVRDDTPAAGISPKFQLLSEPGSADGMARSDVIIGALRISTFDTPPIVTADIVRRMRAGSVIVDVTAGFGAGYIQTSAQLTSLDAPYHVTGGVKHIKIRTLPLGVHRTAAAQISRLYAPAIYRLIASLLYLDVAMPWTAAPAGARHLPPFLRFTGTAQLQGCSYIQAGSSTRIRRSYTSTLLPDRVAVHFQYHADGSTAGEWQDFEAEASWCKVDVVSVLGTLTKNRLTVISTLGDYTGTPYTSGSTRFICIAAAR